MIAIRLVLYVFLCVILLCFFCVFGCLMFRFGADAFKMTSKITERVPVLHKFLQDRAHTFSPS